MFDRGFYKGKRVFVTGHTGFKGAWLCRILTLLGAEVTGFALAPPTDPSLFEICGMEKSIKSVIGDVRDADALERAFSSARPEIVLHLAAQPLVRESYDRPSYTYQTNVMGTVNILECVRKSDSVKSFLNVTTDKVYYNADEPDHAFKEDEPLDGYDPYSNSKSCSELVTHSYKKSFFADGRVAISTARAGNVIGGGDFAADRIIPDAVRAVINGQTDVHVRNPHSTRPYQHVIEPLIAYLMICEAQYRDARYSGWYNVGPDECDCVTTGGLMDIFCSAWGDGLGWHSHATDGPHEASFLKLDNSKIKKELGWRPKWHIRDAVERTCRWTKVYLNDSGKVSDEMARQIEEYLDL